MALPIYSGLINSPSWYISSVLDTFEWNHEEKSGIFYYGSRNLIYFMKVYELANKSKLVDYKITKNKYETKIQYYMKAHHDYVAGLCTIPNGLLMPFKDMRLMPRFTSCGKDKMIRIWSFNEDSGCCCLKEFNLSSTKIVTNPTCISINSSNMILCGFEKGYLLSWNYLVESESEVFYTINENIVQIAWKDNKFAVSFKNGIVIIYSCTSYDSIAKLTQFRAHSSEVCNISWNPIRESIELWGDLATSGKDRKVKLWRTEKNLNWRTLTLPISLKKSNNPEIIAAAANDSRDNPTPGSLHWCSIFWSSVTKNGALIVSTGFGIIGTWKSPASTELRYFSQNNFTKSHSKSIFGISEFRNHNSLILSHSLDRLINISCITTGEACGEHVYSIPGLGGSVLSMNTVAHSNQLAIGCSDNQIRLWRLENANNRYRSEMSTVWNGVNGKVMTLSWHPSKEGLLVFGTDGGDVGCVNVSKDTKMAVTSQLHHTGKVYVATWAADIRGGGEEGVDDKVVAYTVDNNALFLHDFQHNDFVGVSHLVTSCDSARLWVSDFVGHDSLRYVAVGFSSGLVRVFAIQKRRCTLVCQLTTHSKGINCMRWCPGSLNDNGLCFRLAVGSNERFVTVTDVGTAISSFEGTHDSWTVVEFNEPLAMFKGHGDRVTSIDWCPFDTDRLVSASYDQTAIVWSVSKKCAVASFTWHHGRVLSCQWSGRDADLIYTGGEDGNLFVWRPSAQQACEVEPNRRRNHAPPIPGISAPDGTVQGSATTVLVPDNKGDTKETKEKTVKELGPTVPFTKKRGSLFPTMFSMQHSQEAYQKSVLQFIDDSRRDYLPCLTLLDSRAAIVQQIEHELVHHRDGEKNLDKYFLLLLWLGKVGRVASESVSMNYSADWLMTIICGYAARDVPSELVAMMANNAVNVRKDPVLAATYWLAAGQPRTAIELLVRNECPREALILAKLRLPPSDPIIGQLLPKLREKYHKTGSFELAAVCSMLMHEFQDAVDSLGRRTSKLASWITIKILIKYHQEELMQHCAFNFINLIMLEAIDRNPQSAVDNQQWIDNIHTTNEISVYSVLLDLHRYLWVDLKSLKEIWDLLDKKCEQYRGTKLSKMADQIQSKLMTKQTNQSENQISLYLTYEMMLLIIRYNSNNVESVCDWSVFGPMNDLIEQLNKINSTGEQLISRLVGSEQEQHEQIIKMITTNLSRLKLTDEPKEAHQ